MKNGLRLRLLISFHIQHLADTYRIKDIALEFGSRYQTIRQMEFKKSPLRQRKTICRLIYYSKKKKLNNFNLKNMEGIKYTLAV